MGRLSPRTRNAQVALYQDKEVDFLVATDAIGMGLNMDVDHVAFAAPRQVRRPPSAPAHGRRDGADCRSRRPRHARRDVRHHGAMSATGRRGGRRGRGARLRGARPALLAQQRSRPQPCGHAAGDTHGAAAGGRAWSRATTRPTWRPSPRWRTIRRYAASPTDGGRSGGYGRPARSRTSANWRTTPTPNSAPGVFGHIARDQHLPTDWLAGQIGALSRSDGDIDTLMQRLAGVRIWSYIAARGDWVKDSPHWQGQAREVEDLLSDALHERLTSRFVDRRAAHLMRRLEAGETEELLSAVTRRGEVIVEGHPVGRVGGFSFYPDPAARGRREAPRAARCTPGAPRGDAAPRRGGGSGPRRRLRLRRRSTRSSGTACRLAV